MRILKLFLVLGFSILLASPVLAADLSSVSCGTYVIRLGDSQLDVKEKCGNPIYTVGHSWVYEYEAGSSGPYIVIHFGAASVFKPKVVRIEEVQELPSGDQP